MPYDTALEHQKKCQFKKQPCPMNCGQKIFLHELDKHEKLCLNYEVKCEKCEMTYMPNRVKSYTVEDNILTINQPKEHDCFKELLALKEKNEVKIAYVK